ncbi:SDR family oxidoreductase [Sunxiuqinia sp. sy24]|uniref:SDR family oxidoreductase n=1 Tax=Sunxiuqinia sp. sy24 TaxID=3461495 RepID=UPI0040453B27
MKISKILLAGATGYLGRFVASELQNQNYLTTILVRDKNKVSPNLIGMKTIVAEITKPDTLHGIMNDVDAVISTVGITRQKDGLTYMDVDYQGNLNLLNEAKKAGVKKFIYVSAFNADKLTHLKMCYAKERFVQELKKSGLDYCIIRPNGFFSDMTEFLKMAKKGKAELFGDGNYRMNPIHGADLAEVCVNAINDKERTIEVGGPEVLTHNEIVDLAFSTLNKKVKVSYMPEWMRKTTLWFARSFSSSKTYGPMEFFFTVLSMDMVAPKYGTHTLRAYFDQHKNN